MEKMQVFCPWSSLRMSACTVPLTFDSTSLRMVAYCSLDGGLPFSAVNLSTSWSMAAFKNMASMIGAGPSIVMDTEVVGEQRSKPE